jgi:hypothetical protein
MAVRRIAHPSVDDRRAKGKQAQDRTPLSSHQRWAPAVDRPDPVALLQQQDATREPDLVPVRRGRMLVLTGKGDHPQPGAQADPVAVVDSVADLPALLRG